MIGEFIYSYQLRIKEIILLDSYLSQSQKKEKKLLKKISRLLMETIFSFSLQEHKHQRNRLLVLNLVVLDIFNYCLEICSQLNSVLCQIWLSFYQYINLPLYQTGWQIKGQKVLVILDLQRQQYKIYLLFFFSPLFFKLVVFPYFYAKSCLCVDYLSERSNSYLIKVIYFIYPFI